MLRAVRGMRQGFSDHHHVLYRVRLADILVKRRVAVTGVRRIRKKLRGHQYKKDMLGVLSISAE